MKRHLSLKFKEALSSVLPIVVIVVVLHITIAPMPLYTMVLFLVSAFVLILGVAFFTLGVDISMMPMGEKIGSNLVKTRNLPLIIVITFIIGVFISIAEPDLKILAGQISAIPDNILITAVAIGVGISLVLSFLRVLFQIKLSYLLIVLYLIVFILSAFTNKDFLSVAFESGGVTTGPIMVPFVMALGLGLALVRGDKTSEEDSFGLISFCLIGPIITVLILGIFYNPTGGDYSTFTEPNVNSLSEVFQSYLIHTPQYIKEVALALLPIILLFLIFQAFSLHLNKKTLLKMFVGTIYTFIGLVLFLTSVNVGFMPTGSLLGNTLVKQSYSWLLIPLGMIVGYFIVTAEPAVFVLKQQVEEITDGTISAKSMGISLSIGVALSVGLSMLRVITGMSILYFIIPGYMFALILTFFVPPLFTTIAFDSGAVASGPLAATFLLPFAMGASKALGGNILTDAFGIVAFVAMVPVITIQCLGLLFQIKSKRAASEEARPLIEDTIIEYNVEEDTLLDDTSLNDNTGGKYHEEENVSLKEEDTNVK